MKSDSIKELAAALAKAQAAMGGALKDSKNPAFNSKYADLSSVVDAIKPHLSTNGIAYMQFPVTNDKDEVGVETILMHASGEYIHSDPSFFIPVAKANAHGFGSALTYARRYALASACGLKADDDDGNAAAAATPTDAASRIVAAGNGRANAEGSDILSSMGDEERAFLHGEAMKLIAMFEGNEPVQIAEDKAASYVSAAKYDDEEKMALWILLPSKVRNGIKAGATRMNAERKKVPA